jgi:hypothetical protein
MSAMVEADTLLTVDVGSVNTRASLFDVVDGRYRLVATGRASSTAGPPLFDVSEGVRNALDQLRQITGRRLVDETESLVMPATRDGSGVDVFVATTSAGPRVRAVLVGLMPGISVESAQRLASSTYLEVVEQIGLMDRRREEEQIDVILAARPDLLLVVGGTDAGAGASVLGMVDVASLAANLLPDGQKPRVVYAGNRTLAASVVERFGDRTPVALAPNLRPAIGEEDLEPARRLLSEVIAEARAARISGFDELSHWSGGHLLPTAEAFGRVVRYLSRVYDRRKGVLGVDLGASQTTIAAAFDGDLRLSVHSDLGLGDALTGLLRYSTLDKIARWLPFEMAESDIHDYLSNKALHPGTLPVEPTELHLEYALARQALRTALGLARASWPEVRGQHGAESMPALEPILASGGPLARCPRPGYTVLVLLDSLQPSGVSTLVLDPYSLMPAMGAAASVLPMASVQVLESGSFVSLATVVSPVGQGRFGRPVLRLRLERDDGGEAVEGEVRLGQMVTIPLGQGQHAKLTLRPERGFDVGCGGNGKAGILRVAGGAVGVVIDARGRPLRLPVDPARRIEMIQKWMWDLGAQL